MHLSVTADLGRDEQDQGISRRSCRVMESASDTWRKSNELRQATVATVCSYGDDALDQRRRIPHGPRYGCPGVGLPDFAILQWMAHTHSGSGRTSSAARAADTYPRRVDLACPTLTRDAKNSDSVSASDTAVP